MTRPDIFADSFRYWRRQGLTASRAISRAYGDAFTGQRRYSSAVSTGYGNPAPWNIPAGREVRFIESPADLGLREVGDAHELSRMNHTGWFTNEFQDETYTGAVLQLPAHKGQVRLVAAYRESMSGGYVVELSRGAVFSEAVTGHGDYWPELRDLDATRDAARAADRFAEREAEKEREYQAAWQAGNRWADLGEEIRNARREALALIRDAKAKCSALAEGSPVRDAVKGALESILETIRDARDKRAKLAEGEGLSYSRYESPAFYFYSGEQRLRDAFNEGAGATVLA